MAKKGTFSALQTQPQVPSGRFAGEQAFAQMAQTQAQKRAEERAEQRQLKAEYRQAVSNAIDAGNIDYTEINKNVHKMVGSVLDWYGEKTADFMETMNEDYSFEKQMEISQLKTEFQSKIGKLQGLGQQIEGYAQGEWDNLMSIKSQNQLVNFTRNIPSLADSFNPEDMTVGGEDIVQKFRKEVDTSGFVEPIASEEALDQLGSFILSDANVEETREDAGEFYKKFKVYNWDRTKARGTFKSEFVGTDAYEKVKHQILLEYVSIDDAQKREDYEDNYMKIDSDGEAYVTENGVFNWFEDTELIPRQKQPDGTVQKSITSAGRGGGDDDIMKRANRLRNIVEPFEGELVGLDGVEIQVDGLKGQIDKGGKAYNPITGEAGMSVIFNVEDNMGKYSFVRMYENSLAGAQEFAHHVHGDDFDYRYLSNLHERETGERIGEPQPSFTFTERESSVRDMLGAQRQTYETILASRLSEDDLRNAGERAFKYATQSFPETNKPNNAFANFVADYMQLNDQGSVLGKALSKGLGVEREPFAKGYGLENLKIDTKLKYKIDKTKDGFEPDKEAAVLSKLMTVARAMKSDGKSDQEIANSLVKYANNIPRDDDGNIDVPVVDGEIDYDAVIPYEFDRVKRHINEKYTNEDVASQKTEFASQLLRFGMPDKEINNAIDSIDHQAVQNNVKDLYGDSFSVTQFWSDAVEAANESGMSLQEFLKAKGLL